MDSNAAENKMAIEPIHKILLKMGLPMMLSMIAFALYNMVDTFFVSRIPDTAQIAQMGDKAVNALTLAYPIQMLMIAFGVGLGIGLNTQVSANLGRKDRETAGYDTGNGILMSVVVYIMFLIFGIFAAGAYIRSQTQDEVIAAMGTEYLRIVTILSAGTIGHMCVEKAVMGTARTMFTMIAQLTGAIVNIIFDPIMIYGLFGLPALGVRGAAIATVAGQFVSLIMISLFLIFGCPEIPKGLKYLRPRGDIMRIMLAVSIPATLLQAANPVMSYSLNLIFGSISTSTVTAFGVYYKIQYFVTMPIFGLNNASIPLASFNRGAGKYERVGQTIKFGLIYAGILMAVFMIILETLFAQIIGLFAIAPESARICTYAVRIVSLGYLFLGSNYMLQGICQSLNDGIKSMLVTFIRTLIVVLPLAFALSKTYSAETVVWVALPVAEAVGLVFAVIFTVRTYRKMTSEKPAAAL